MNVYQTTVMSASALLAFLIAGLLGRVIVPALRRLHFGQTILEDGPKWHMSKQGTPTMGGVLFVAGMVLAFAAALFACEVFLPCKIIGQASFSGIGQGMLIKLFGGLLTMLLFGGIGFADDYIKVVKKRNLGLTSGQKLLAQVLVAAAFAIAVFNAGDTTLHVPFVGMVDFGFWYIPFTVLVFVGATNATNLTDGVDGLCGTLTFVASLFLLIIAATLGFFGQSVLTGCLAGGVAGFLLWNLHPAKTFMGDTGSLFLGAALTAICFGIGRPFLLLPVGIVFIIETLSVILQVGYFKLTHGKRLFKMSPLHHHFEMCGYSENRIVLTFGAVGMIGGIIGILMTIFSAY